MTPLRLKAILGPRQSRLNEDIVASYALVTESGEHVAYADLRNGNVTNYRAAEYIDLDKFLRDCRDRFNA